MFDLKTDPTPARRSQAPEPQPAISRREFHAIASAGVAAAMVPGAAYAQAPRVRPYRVEVPQAKLDEIKAQVRLSKLPRVTDHDGWDTGMDVAWLERLKRYWLEHYDWRAAEAAFNRYPQFVADVDGEQLHFLHVRGSGPLPKPLLLAHGWPYTNLSFTPFIDRLTDPARFGGDPVTALTVVAPAIPGHGFGGKPDRMCGPKRTAQLFHALMTSTLGYARYGFQGGDHGAGVGNWIAFEQPGALIGLHSNMLITKAETREQLAPAERPWKDAGDAFWTAQMDYLRLQTNKPMLAGAALAASPMATAAWVAEKYWSWSDQTAAPDGDLDKLYAPDRLLTEIMSYVVTDTIETSFWHYRGGRDEIHGDYHPGGRIVVPTANARFAFDYPFGRPPRSVAERSFNIVRFTDFQRGGHFPFLEQPQPFADDIRTFFAGLSA